MATRTLGVVIAVACSLGIMGASPPALKPFDPDALQAAVEATGKELMLPGAMVLLRTPQGDFAQPDCLARRPAHRQQHDAENARPDLHGLAASVAPRGMSASGHERTLIVMK